MTLRASPRRGINSGGGKGGPRAILPGLMQPAPRKGAAGPKPGKMQRGSGHKSGETLLFCRRPGSCPSPPRAGGRDVTPWGASYLFPPLRRG